MKWLWNQSYIYGHKRSWLSGVAEASFDQGHYSAFFLHKTKARCILSERKVRVNWDLF